MSSLEQQISCKLHGKASPVESVRMSFTKSRSFRKYCQASVFVSAKKKRNKHVLSISKRRCVVGRRNVFVATLSYFNLVIKSFYYRLQRNFQSLLLII